MTEDELTAAGPHTRSLPMAEYHGGPGVSKSMLDWVHISPSMLPWSRNAPEDEEADSAVDIGSALHAMLLEPDTFDAQYIRDFEPPRDAIATVDQIKAALDARGVFYKSAAGKGALAATLLDADPQAPIVDALRGEWEKGTNGRIVLSRSDWRKAQLMRASVMAHPTARHMLTLPGETERCHYWVDEDTGELCRCRMDREIPSVGVIVDLKTTGTMKWFDRSIADYRYHVQEEWYREGWKQTQGEAPLGFSFIVVGTMLDRKRYPVSVVEIEQGSRDIARMELRQDLETYSAARKSNDWISIQTAGLPYFKGY